MRSQSRERHHEPELTDSAHSRVEDLCYDFAEGLIRHARNLARQERLDTISSIHVDEALNIVKRNLRRNRWRPYLAFFGGTITGSAIQGFINALDSMNQTLIVVYAVLSVAGIITGVLGLLKS